MSYAVLSDLQKLLSDMVLLDLTDDEDSGTIDSVIVDNALETADVEINAYLAERYSVPLDPVPEILNKMASDLAVFNLYARREGPPDHWQARYNNWIKMLVKIRDGKLGLGVADPEAGTSDTAQVVSKDRVFTRDTLKGF